MELEKFQNLWDRAKAFLREKIITIQAYHKQTRKNIKTNNVTLLLMELEKEK